MIAFAAVDDARDQPAAADGNDQHVEIGDGVQHLQRYRSLTGNDQRIVVGMDEGEAVAVGDAMGKGFGVAQRVAMKKDAGAIGLGPLHLREGGLGRHDDGRRYAETGGVISDTLGVIAGGHGDDALCRFSRRKAFQLVERAALLERTGVMQAFQLEVNAAAGLFRKAG